MRRAAGRLALGLSILGLTACQGGTGAPPGLPLDEILLPPGFTVELHAIVPGARSLVLASDGRTLYAGTTTGSVAAVRDHDGDGVADSAVQILDGLDGVVSVASGPDGVLYAIDRRSVFRVAPGEPPAPIVPAGVLPGARQAVHYAAFGPDERLYVGVPAACARCARAGLGGTILRMRPDGHGLEVFARGVRDVRGFDWHAASGLMFFTDQSSRPGKPDELNRAPAAGLHFGYPGHQEFATAGDGLLRAARLPPTFPAVLDLTEGGAGPLEFYDGQMFPADFRGDALTVVRGAPGGGRAGFRLLRVRFSEAAHPYATEVLAQGWLTRGGNAWGSPSDLEELPDGSLLIADDRAGVIYRLSYQSPR